MNDAIYRQAQKKVQKKKNFYRHLSVYIAVSLFFFILNMVTLGDDPEIWFFFPMLPWGVGLLIHYFSMFGLPWTNALTEEWEEKELRKEMERAERKLGLPAERKDFQLDDDYESFDLQQPKKVRVDKWQKEDLV